VSVCEQKQEVCVCKFVGVFDLKCHIKKTENNKNYNTMGPVLVQLCPVLIQKEYWLII
jgi:hypothetical protein